jgi:hypothetical protein
MNVVCVNSDCTQNGIVKDGSALPLDVLTDCVCGECGQPVDTTDEP